MRLDQRDDVLGEGRVLLGQDGQHVDVRLAVERQVLERRLVVAAGVLAAAAAAFRGRRAGAGAAADGGGGDGRGAAPAARHPLDRPRGRGQPPRQPFHPPPPRRRPRCWCSRRRRRRQAPAGLALSLAHPPPLLLPPSTPPPQAGASLGHPRFALPTASLFLSLPSRSLHTRTHKMADGGLLMQTTHRLCPMASSHFSCQVRFSKELSASLATLHWGRFY